MKSLIVLGLAIAAACGQDAPAGPRDTARSGRAMCPKCMQTVTTSIAVRFEVHDTIYYLHPAGGDQWCEEGFTQWPDSYASGQPDEGCPCPVHMRGCNCGHCRGTADAFCPCLEPLDEH